MELMKRFLTIFLLAVTLTIPLVQADFSDISDDSYADSIQYLQDKGVIEGYDNGHFQPENAITRAEFIKMLLANYQVDPDSVDTLSFPYQDVPEESWFAPYVQKAYEIGLLNDKTELNPHQTITRVEATQLVLNLLGIPIPRLIHEESWTLNYRDVRYNSWYAPTILYGELYGIIEPLDVETPEYFRPLKRLTRGEATQILFNMDVFLYGSLVGQNLAELETEVFGEELTYEIPHLDIFLDVWTRLHTSYFGRTELDTSELIYQALTGMIDALGDDYSYFFPPDESASYISYLEGELSGIGAHLTTDDEGYNIIHSFITNGPAESSGLSVNDRIMVINDIDVSNMELYEIVEYIRGEAGTDVTISVERRNVEELLEFTITRAVVDIGYISGELIDNAIYVDINLFDSLSFIDFTQTIQPLIDENPDFEGFIFDLRDNPGGYLDAVRSMLGHFIPYGHPVIYAYYGDNHSAFYMSEGDGEWADYPVIMLINEESASASEIMALTLKEEIGGILVGKTTYGKGTIQEIVRYVGGASLKITIAEWRSPRFHSINGIGISPHYDVDLTLEDLAAGQDPQLETAIEALQLEIEQRAEEAAALEAALEAAALEAAEQETDE